MFLEVEETNAAAIRLYAREGFRTLSTRKGYYPKADGTAATALVMARDLG
jgi:ribosomal-protein-alanine N-acetyltransferase